MRNDQFHEFTSNRRPVSTLPSWKRTPNVRTSAFRPCYRPGQGGKS